MASKAVSVIRFKPFLLTFFAIAYFWLLLRPSSMYSETQEGSIECPSEHCLNIKTETNNTESRRRFDGGRKVEEAKEERKVNKEKMKEKRVNMIALVNLADSEIHEWANAGANTTTIKFEKVPKSIQWRHIFPEWIDEEHEYNEPVCPQIPMPDLGTYQHQFDMVVARLPCNSGKRKWNRDVYRLQVHLVAANLGVKKARKGLEKLPFLFLSSCMPMLEMFRCEELVRHDGDVWLYESNLSRLEEKISLPIGSCKLAQPSSRRKDEMRIHIGGGAPTHAVENHQHERREAYATVLHSSEQYACGAITLAQTLLWTNTTRDLVILVDDSIPAPTRRALRSAGWKIRDITRIRNPNARMGAYNEYNYSKLRLWQLIDYHRVIFIDADIIALRNMDILFKFPQLSASGNDGVIFNSGVMVIEPSNCTFDILMRATARVRSYNGGDQGFLNEVFTWWHRLNRTVSMMKINQWASPSKEEKMKDLLYGSDPPKLYGLHYLGTKPWLCYRDYDCNWNNQYHIKYASDVAHSYWWNVHDKLPPNLQKMCLLTPKRKHELRKERSRAERDGFASRHWAIKIKDRRKCL